MMSRDDYRSALADLGLSQESVGDLLDTGRRTARRWASGESPVPGPVAMHIRLWLERPEILDVVRRIANERDGIRNRSG